MISTLGRSVAGGLRSSAGRQPVFVISIDVGAMAADFRKFLLFIFTLHLAAGGGTM